MRLSYLVLWRYNEESHARKLSGYKKWFMQIWLFEVKCAREKREFLRIPWHWSLDAQAPTGGFSPTFITYSQSWMSSCTSLGERNNAAVYFCLPEESPFPRRCRDSNWGKKVVREAINYISWDKTVRIRHKVHRSAARQRSRTRFFKINKNIIFNNETRQHWFRGCN